MKVRFVGTYPMFFPYIGQYAPGDIEDDAPKANRLRRYFPKLFQAVKQQPVKKEGKK